MFTVPVSISFYDFYFVWLVLQILVLCKFGTYRLDFETFYTFVVDVAAFLVKKGSV